MEIGGSHMSLLFIDGFDDNLSSLKWSSYNANSLSSGRNGNAAYLGDNTKYMLKQVAVADEHATFILGCGLYITGIVPSFFLELRSDDRATVHLRFYFNANNQISVYRGPGTTLLGSTPISGFAFNTWFHFEVKAVLHDSTGSVVIKFNGVTVLNLTGIDTKNAGTKTGFDTVEWWGTNTAGATTIIVDDFYLCNGAGSVNNDFLGDCTIQTLYPSGNGNYSQWVGSDADSTNNYLLVDENPPNTTDYVESGTATNKDTYTFGDLTGAPAVKGVATSIYMSKSDAGAQLMRQTARIGGTDYPSATDDAPSFGSYLLSNRMMEVSPATSSLWTYTEVNGAEFGVEAR